METSNALKVKPRQEPRAKTPDEQRKRVSTRPRQSADTKSQNEQLKHSSARTRTGTGTKGPDEQRKPSSSRPRQQGQQAARTQQSGRVADFTPGTGQGPKTTGQPGRNVVEQQGQRRDKSRQLQQDRRAERNPKTPSRTAGTRTAPPADPVQASPPVSATPPREETAPRKSLVKQIWQRLFNRE